MRYTRTLRFAFVLAIGVAAGDTPGALFSPVSAKLGLRTIAELKFDKEIEDVAFGSYMVGGREWYYPKVVVRRQGPVVPKWQQREVELSVEILDSTGRVVNRIPHLKYFSRVWLSNSGNFIGVEEVPGQVGEDYPGRRPAPVRFTM
ncbi:MAG: hypothetical protein NTX53_06870, partial [candidate division WOR-3 bacterium]|nr:hypothetical protein [candidate division WOR-3 bacterium]